MKSAPSTIRSGHTGGTFVLRGAAYWRAESREVSIAWASSAPAPPRGSRAPVISRVTTTVPSRSWTSATTQRGVPAQRRPVPTTATRKATTASGRR
ncbi:hypothetical protein D9M68_935990 [compost metagenome]